MRLPTATISFNQKQPMMKKNNILALWAISALMAVTLAACSDDTLTEEQQHTKHLLEQLKGSWVADIDGTSYDIAFLNLQLSEQQASSMDFWIYNGETDDYEQIAIPVAYQVVRRTYKGTESDMLAMVIDTAAVNARYPDLWDSVDDIMNELVIKRLDSDSLTVIDTGEDTGIEVGFARRTFDVSKADKAAIRQLVAEVKERMEKERTPGDATDYDSYPDADDMEYINNNYPSSAAPERLPAKRAVSSSDYELNNWMSFVNDDELVCNLCIPSAHDATTYNIWELMNPFGKSQGIDLKTQFDRGVRVFDLRIRNNKVIVPLANHCFHDCLNCNVEFVDALDDIVEKVTADGSQEGAIVWVSPEKNGFFNFALSNLTASEIATLSRLEFDGTSLDRPMCVKKAVEEIKEHLYDKGLLASFKRDLKMKDLRRKVLVLFEHPTDEGETVDWGELAGYIGIKSDDAITRADGKEVAVVHQQNDWGPDSGQSNDAFMLRKKRGFIDMLYTHAQVRDMTWIFNACNAYISDPLPNYSVYCAKLYPTFTKHLNLKQTRGIFQTDYCGLTEFTRLQLSQVIAIVTVKVFTVRVLDDGVAFIAIAGAIKARTPDKVMSYPLICSMIYNNFRHFR